MNRAIRPAWLLRLASELGGADAGRGQPRNTDLRRAVSTAYYALFHRLTLAVAEAALPGAGSAEVYGLARHVSHSSIKQVCSYVTGETPPKHLGATIDRLRANHELSNIAGVFVALQQQREDADYNHLADFTRPDVLGSVARAGQAVELVDALTDDRDLRAFLSLVTLRTSIAR